MLLGGIIGLGVGLLSESLGDGEVEDVPPEEDVEEITEEDIAAVLSVVEGAVVIIALVMIFFAVMFGDKNGTAIFTMPDVDLLFAAPMKPQSVLLFKLMNQIFIMLAASVYFLFQIPSLVINLGLSVFAGIMIFVAWLALIVVQKLVSVFVYTLASTHIRVKKFLRPAAFGMLGIVLILYAFIYINNGDLFESFKLLFVGEATRYVPVFGWLKGLVMWSIEGYYLRAALAFLLLAAFSAGLTYFIWRLKADFYEEAMQESQKNAEKLAAMQSGSSAKRDKDRADKIKRDGLDRGSGANIFFFKSLYNRKRFSHFGFLTKTTEFYLFVSLTAALLMRFVFKTDSFLPIGLGLTAFVFFRSLGNPLAVDMDKACFVTIPASAHEKVLWSMLAGITDCALDLLPAFVASAFIIGASPLEAVMLYLLAVSVDYYSSNVMLFIEFSLPSSLALQLKQMVAVMFIYFGLVPIAAVVAVGFVLGLVDIFLLIASGAALVIGTAFFVFSPIFIEKGRK